NLPQSVNQGSATKATYGWFSDGTKYSVQDSGGNGFYYIGSLIYSISSGSTTLESTDFSEGRITISFGSQSIEYHHRDHLGSIRVITNSTGLTSEQNAYYPFGARHSYGSRWLTSLTNRHKFNGKEEQTTGSLGYLDYGARMYDPQTARWLTQDPLAQKYYPHSPYSFSGNNPVLYVDSDGRVWDVFLDIGSLAYDIGSAIYNHITGNHQQAKQNWVDVGLDVASAFIPGVTAPMTKLAVEGTENIIDITRHSRYISPNKGIAKPHGKNDHNAKIDEFIDQLKQNNDNSSIRKNQRQVNINGNTVGSNRPDVQWDYNGVHHILEVDRTLVNNRKHKQIIELNDPNAIFHKIIIK
ncbi:MAG: RHS repeat-associated core domain-containing protein, partial [Lachnospiraceae bacterium]|nr:RHS repeat-associated core domain-containing protein [Lachnospiraceae bacterium]